MMNRATIDGQRRPRHPRPGGPTCAAAAAAIALALISACGGSTTKGTPNREGAARNRTTSTSAAARNQISDDIDAAHGLVVATCEEKSVTLAVLDPGDGHPLASRSFDLPSFNRPASERPPGTPISEVARICGQPVRGQFLRNSAVNLIQRGVFDSNYRRVTATVEQPDGSIHAGFIDVHTGTFTDVTKRRAPNDPNAGLVKDIHPLFHGRNDDLWFVETVGEGDPGKVFKVDRATKSDAASTEATEQKIPRYDDTTELVEGGFTLAPDADVVVDNGVPNPSGAFAVSSIFNGSLSLSVPPFGLDDERRPTGTSIRTTGDMKTNCGDPAIRVGIGYAFLDEHRFICPGVAVPYQTLASVEVSDDLTAASVKTIVSFSDRSAEDPVLAPDRSKVAFLSSRNGETLLDAVDPGGATPPQKISSLVGVPLGEAVVGLPRLRLVEWK